MRLSSITVCNILYYQVDLAVSLCSGFHLLAVQEGSQHKTQTLPVVKKSICRRNRHNNYHYIAQGMHQLIEVGMGGRLREGRSLGSTLYPS